MWANCVDIVKIPFLLTKLKSRIRSLTY